MAAVPIAALWAAIPLLFLAPASTTGQYLVISLALVAVACGILAVLRRRVTAGVLCLALACVSAVLTLRLDMLEGHALTYFTAVYSIAMIGLSQLCRAEGKLAEVAHRPTVRQNAGADHTIAAKHNAGICWLFETNAAGHLTRTSTGLSDTVNLCHCEPAGRPLASLFSDGPPGAGWDRVSRAMEARHPINCAVEIANGAETRLWQVASLPLLAEDGKFSGYRGIAHDITSGLDIGRGCVDDQEPDGGKNRQTLKFLQDVIQEVKLPLSTILGFTEILQSPAARDLPEDEHQTYQQLLLDHCRQLTSFITDAGDMARFDTNNFQLVEQEADAAELTEIAMKSCQAAAEELDAAAVVNVIENVELRCDAVRICRVLETLVTRAFKAGGSGSCVHVFFACKPDGSLEISVLDQGPALTPDELARAFEPALHERGMDGLSLPIARRIALLHGGNLTVETSHCASMIARLTLPAGRVTWNAGTEFESIRAA